MSEVKKYTSVDGDDCYFSVDSIQYMRWDFKEDRGTIVCHGSWDRFDKNTFERILVAWTAFKKRVADA